MGKPDGPSLFSIITSLDFHSLEIKTDETKQKVSITFTLLFKKEKSKEKNFLLSLFFFNYYFVDLDKKFSERIMYKL